MHKTLTLAAALLAALSMPAAAKDSAKDKAQAEAEAPPPVFQAVIDCKTLADPTARLACYDKAVTAMASARETKDLVVADRATMREARKGLFGLSLPRIKLFGGNGDSDEVTAIDSTITSVYAAKDGFTVFVLADGARWKQTDGRFQYPKAGQSITIRKGSLGSYLANINKQSAVKVMRIM